MRSYPQSSGLTPCVRLSASMLTDSVPCDGYRSGQVSSPKKRKRVAGREGDSGGACTNGTSRLEGGKIGKLHHASSLDWKYVYSPPRSSTGTCSTMQFFASQSRHVFLRSGFFL